RRRTEAPVISARLFENPVLAPAAELLHGLREDRGGVEHRRVHGAVMPLGVESGMDDACLFAHGAPSCIGLKRKAVILTATGLSVVSTYNYREGRRERAASNQCSSRDRSRHAF